MPPWKIIALNEYEPSSGMRMDHRELLIAGLVQWKKHTQPFVI